MNLIGRLFGPRRHQRPTPSPADVAAVDVERMVATARERGDRRSHEEVLAALLVGAELTADRHHDGDMRLRAAAAAVALRDVLVAAAGEDEAARLFADSAGPVDEAGQPRR